MKKLIFKLFILLFIMMIALSICVSVNATEVGAPEAETPETENPEAIETPEVDVRETNEAETDEAKADDAKADDTETDEAKTNTAGTNTTGTNTTKTDTTGTNAAGTDVAKANDTEANEVKLTKLKFDDKETAVVKTGSTNVIKIPTELEFTGKDVDKIDVNFESESGEKYGPITIYTKEDGKKDLEISIEGDVKEGEKYYLTDIFLMKKLDKDYETLMQYVTTKSATKSNGKDIVNHSTEYYFVLSSTSVGTKKTTNENTQVETKQKDETPKTGNIKYIIIRYSLMLGTIIAFIAIVKSKKRV